MESTLVHLLAPFQLVGVNTYVTFARVTWRARVWRSREFILRISWNGTSCPLARWMGGWGHYGWRGNWRVLGLKRTDAVMSDRLLNLSIPVSVRLKLSRIT